MGTSYQIFCTECGYDRGNIMVGCGMSGPEPEYEVAPCYKCGVVKRIDISKNGLVCNRCKFELKPFDSDADSYECPKCHKMTLQKWFGGMWD